MPNHAEITVVEDGDLDRQPLLAGGGQLLDVHLDGAVAGDIDDHLVRRRHLGADGRGKAVAHDAQAAGGHEMTRLVEMIELGRPHLVLADLGGDDGVAAGQLMQLLDDELRLDNPGLLDIPQRMPALPFPDLLVPGGMAGRRLLAVKILSAVEPSVHGDEGVLAVGDYGDVDPDVLADGRRVDIDMDNLRMRGKGVHPAGNAVVETGAHRDQQVAVGDGHVGVVGAPMRVMVTGISSFLASSVRSSLAFEAITPPPA